MQVAAAPKIQTTGKENPMKEVWYLTYTCLIGGKRVFKEKRMEAASYLGASSERKKLELDITENAPKEESDHKDFGFSTREE